MSELPDNVDLRWIGEHLVAFRDETRGAFRGVGRELQGLRDDVNVSAAILRRMDNNADRHGDEIRMLYELIADLRRRLETLEAAKP